MGCPAGFGDSSPNLTLHYVEDGSEVYTELPLSVPLCMYIMMAPSIAEVVRLITWNTPSPSPVLMSSF